MNARSVNISHLVYLDFNDFIEKLKEYPEDLVFFYNLKKKIKVKNNKKKNFILK